MSQDVVADGLNQIMNAKKSGKKSVLLKRHSKLLVSVLAIGKLRSYIEDYNIEGNKIEVNFTKLNKCRAIKPRFVVKNRDIEKYIRRYLPGRGIGILIVSTNEGIMTHYTAIEKKLGGVLIAYFY
jgi:small subunit ribosomal protein S8